VKFSVEQEARMAGQRAEHRAKNSSAADRADALRIATEECLRVPADRRRMSFYVACRLDSALDSVHEAWELSRDDR
jgi:hypothetical protein